MTATKLLGLFLMARTESQMRSISEIFEIAA